MKPTALLQACERLVAAAQSSLDMRSEFRIAIADAARLCQQLRADDVSDIEVPPPYSAPSAEARAFLADHGLGSMLPVGHDFPEPHVQAEVPR